MPEQEYQITNKGVYVKDSFEPARAYSVWGRVLQVPERLVFHHHIKKLKRAGKVPATLKSLHMRLLEQSLEFDDQTIKIKNGDLIMFKYTCHMTAADEGMRMRDGSMLIRYDRIYGIMKPRGFQPINGWIFGKPLSLNRFHKTKGSFRVLLDNRADNAMVVTHLAPPLKGYSWETDCCDGQKINLGDLIYHSRKMAAKVEYDSYRKLSRDTEHGLVRIQRKDIMLIQKKRDYEKN